MGDQEIPGNAASEPQSPLEQLQICRDELCTAWRSYSRNAGDWDADLQALSAEEAYGQVLTEVQTLTFDGNPDSLYASLMAEMRRRVVVWYELIPALHAPGVLERTIDAYLRRSHYYWHGFFSAKNILEEEVRFRHVEEQKAIARDAAGFLIGKQLRLENMLIAYTPAITKRPG